MPVGRGGHCRAPGDERSRGDRLQPLPACCGHPNSAPSEPVPWKRQPEPHPGLPCRLRARKRALQDGRQTSGYQMGGSREMGK